MLGDSAYSTRHGAIRGQMAVNLESNLSELTIETKSFFAKRVAGDRNCLFWTLTILLESEWSQCDTMRRQTSCYATIWISFMRYGYKSMMDQNGVCWHHMEIVAFLS